MEIISFPSYLMWSSKCESMTPKTILVTSMSLQWKLEHVEFVFKWVFNELKLSTSIFARATKIACSLMSE